MRTVAGEGLAGFDAASSSPNLALTTSDKESERSREEKLLLGLSSIVEAVSALASFALVLISSTDLFLVVGFFCLVALPVALAFRPLAALGLPEGTVELLVLVVVLT